MADWILVACLVTLRNEFNRIAANRDRTTDGSIGDTAHQNSTSDHNQDEFGKVPITDADKTNEVHAIDVDVDLRVSGLTMEKVVQFLLERCRSGAENRLRYIIFNKRIWSASSGWVQKAYTGASPHTEHAHFSASYNSKHEASTASWHLEDLVAVTQAEIDKIAAAVAKKVWDHTEANPYDNGKTERRTGGELRMMEYRDDARARATNIERLDNQVIPMLRQIIALASSLNVKVDALDIIDEIDRAEIAQFLVEGLPDDLAEGIARAILAKQGKAMTEAAEQPTVL